jgi:superfamily II DNA/RNA helicase
LAPALEDLLRGKLDELEAIESSDDDASGLSYDGLQEISEDIRGLIVRAKTLDEHDPKVEAFAKVIHEKVVMPKNKVLVFSTFRHTLSYLVRRLSREQTRLGLVHGGVPDEERAELRRRFSLPKDDPNALDVLLSSEVGCEGLDFQYCDCLVNYDLPWNPMRIEQRIGRIDRYGQQSPTVAIFNFITPGTIDAAIYERCLSRIGVFRHAIGGSEEILGDITREIHCISDAFELSEQERESRLEQLAHNKIRQVEEEQKLEDRQGELFGLNLAEASWADKLKQSRNHWLEPEALIIAVSQYLTRRLEKELDYLMGEKPVRTLRLSQEARMLLLEDYRRLPKSTDPTHRTWERWLKGTNPTLPVTFDQNAATDTPSATIISLSHPLVRQAVAMLSAPDPAYVVIAVARPDLPSGSHPFALYRWQRHGVRTTEEFVGVPSVPLWP